MDFKTLNEMIAKIKEKIDDYYEIISGMQENADNVLICFHKNLLGGGKEKVIRVVLGEPKDEYLDQTETVIWSEEATDKIKEILDNYF